MVTKTFNKEVVTSFDGGHITTNGGIPFITQADKLFGITRRFAALYKDSRVQSMVTHTVEKLVKQKVYGYVTGVEEKNDFDFLADDTDMTVALMEHDNVEHKNAKTVASRMGMNRLEHAAVPGAEDCGSKFFYDPKDVDQLFIDLAAENRRQIGDGKPKEAVLEIDGVHFETHGNQEKSAHHGGYRATDLYPQFVFWGRDLLSTRLRPV